MSGTLGPYTSASSRPTLCPSLARASARFTAKVVFPTPPFPEPTAIIVSTPGRGCGPCGGCPGRGDIGVFKESPSRWMLGWRTTSNYTGGPDIGYGADRFQVNAP